MNGKRAKAIRQEVYGDDYSPKFRRYGSAGKKLSKYNAHTKKTYFGDNGQIVADPRRQAYQKAKKAWTRRNG